MRFNSINFVKNSSPVVDYVKNSIVNGAYSNAIEAVTKDGFVRDHFVRSDADERQNVKILAAIAIANHGRQIADAIKNNNKIDEIKKIPPEILMEVMKMSIQAGITPRNMAAFIEIMRSSGKMEEIVNF